MKNFFADILNNFFKTENSDTKIVQTGINRDDDLIYHVIGKLKENFDISKLKFKSHSDCTIFTYDYIWKDGNERKISVTKNFSHYEKTVYYETIIHTFCIFSAHAQMKLYEFFENKWKENNEKQDREKRKKDNLDKSKLKELL